MSKSRYIEAQLLQLCPIPIEPHATDIKIKISCNRGHTNWLNITTEQLNKIEAILCEGAENEQR